MEDEAIALRAEVLSLRSILAVRRKANDEARSSSLSMEETRCLLEFVRAAELDRNAGQKELEEEKSSISELKANVDAMKKTTEGDREAAETLRQATQAEVDKRSELQKKYEDLKSSCDVQRDFLDRKGKELGDALSERDELGRMLEEARQWLHLLHEVCCLGYCLAKLVNV